MSDEMIELLKNGVREIEQSRRSVYDIVREENRKTQPTRTQDMER